MHADMHLCIYVGINTYKYEYIDTPVYATLYKSIHRYTCAFADRWVHVYKIYNITIDCFVCKKVFNHFVIEQPFGMAKSDSTSFHTVHRLVYAYGFRVCSCIRVVYQRLDGCRCAHAYMYM